ncbi:phage lytic cycle repressor MrpR family protein, partial [Ruminococcus bicirculans (ex Wegman et al. 2014)]|uniref:phage lytic cycle repressor MrpR family protein n=1 Tax=Ruminococcus bicirculans (ex Wegman et al. 2014) TaxID=1160721 RepID=UPI003FD70B23
NQNFFNPKPKIKFLNKMVEDTDSEVSLKNYVYSFSKMSSLEKEYKKDISRMNVNQIKFVLNSCINSYDGFRNMKGLLKLYLTFMDYPYMD